MKTLTDREQNIVLATIRLWQVNAKSGFIPDYGLIGAPFDLPMETKRDIRDIVQEVRPRTFKANVDADDTMVRVALDMPKFPQSGKDTR